MPDFARDSAPEPDSDLDKQIDALGDRFEAAWKTGSPPDLATYLLEVRESSRPEALKELLRVELEIRRARGSSPTLDEYLQRFPEHAAVVTSVFQSVDSRQSETIDTPRPHLTAGFHVRCPHCHNPIELVPEANLSDIQCKSCGGSFSLTGSDQAAPQAEVGTRIGHFELVERLGMGAFGSVWRARDTKLDREVALKVPRKGQLSAQETEMFLREARSAAQLRHPNIVSVHEVGRDGDSVYLVSDLIQGISLDKWLEGQQLAAREAAELCANIADALQHAHERGVIHRDLKPQNILMDATGEPHITDFGLAKREAGEITMTMEGQLLGTPAYMSPEQARGEGHDADQRSDVYSLGVILFQLLTGELPFRGNVRMLLKQVLEEDAPTVRQLDNRIPRDLDTICQKCLAKEPARRYPTARTLTEDLRRFLRQEVIQARPVGRVERTWRWCKRNPVVASSLAIGAVMLAALAWSRTTESQQRKLAESRLEHSRHNVYNLTLARAASLLERQPESAKFILEDATACPWDLHDFTWRILHSAASGKPVVSTVQHLGRVTNVAYSADGKSLIAATPGKLGWWSVETGKATREFNLDENDVSTLAVAPDGSVALVSTPSGGASILTWKKVTDTYRNNVESEKTSTITLSQLSVMARPDPGSYAEQQLKGGSYRPQSDEPDGPLSFTGAHVTADDEAMQYQHEVIIAEPGQGVLSSGSIVGHLNSVLSGCFSPDQKLMATVGKFGKVIIWERRRIWGRLRLNALRAFVGHQGYVSCAAFSPDSKRLITGGEDRSIRVWDVATGKLQATFSGHDSPVAYVVVNQDGQLLLSGDQIGSVRVWDLSHEAEVTSIRAHESEVRSIAVSPDGGFVVTCGKDGTWQQWILTDMSLAPRESSSSDSPKQAYGVAFAPDGNSLALATDGAAITLNWEMQTEANRFAYAPAVTSVAAATDGTAVASGSRDGTIKLWDTASDQEKHTFKAGEKPVASLTFSPDDKLLASVCENGEVDLWDTESGLRLSTRTLPGARSVAFSPKGDALLAGDSGEWAQWDMTSGEIRQPAWQSAIESASEKSGNLIASPRSSMIGIFQYDPYGDKVSHVSIWDWSANRRVLRCKIPIGEPIKWIHMTAGQTASDAMGQVRKSVLSSRNMSLAADGSLIVFGDRVFDTKSNQLNGQTGALLPFLSPDGRTLVSAIGLSIWDPVSVQQRPELIGPNAVFPESRRQLDRVAQCEFSWDGSLLTVGHADGRVTILNAGRQTVTLGSRSRPVAFSSDQRELVTFQSQSELVVRDAGTGQTLRELRLGDYQTYWESRGKTVSANGRFFGQVFVHNDSDPDHKTEFRELRLGTTSSGKWTVTVPLEMPESRNAGIDDSIDGDFVAISNDGKLLGFMSKNKKRFTIRDRRGHKIREITSPGKEWRSYKLSPDFSLLATEEREDSSVRIYDVTTGKERFEAPRNALGVGWNQEFSFSPDSTLLAIGPAAYETSKLEPGSYGAGMRMLLPGRTITAFSQDNKIAVAGGRSQAELFDVASGAKLTSLDTTSKCIAISDDYQTVLAEDGSLWTASTSRKELVRRGKATATSASTGRSQMNQVFAKVNARPVCGFSKDGRLFAIASCNWPTGNENSAMGLPCRIDTWNLGSGEHLVRHVVLDLANPSDWLRSYYLGRIAISNDGQNICLADSDATLWIIDSVNEKVLRSFSVDQSGGRSPPDVPASLELSEDGLQVHAVNRTWNTQTGEQIRSGIEPQHGTIRSPAEQTGRKFIQSYGKSADGHRDLLIENEMVCKNTAPAGNTKENRRQHLPSAVGLFYNDYEQSYEQSCSVIVKDTATDKELRRLPPVKDAMRPFAVITPDGRHLVSFRVDPTGTPVDVHGPQGPTQHILDVRALIWDVDSGEQLRKIKVGRQTSAHLLQDGKTLVSSDGKSNTVWDIQSGKQLSHYLLPATPVATDPADRLMVGSTRPIHYTREITADELTAPIPGFVVWNLMSGDILFRLTMSPDSDWLVQTDHSARISESDSRLVEIFRHSVRTESEVAKQETQPAIAREHTLELVADSPSLGTCGFSNNGRWFIAASVPGLGRADFHPFNTRLRCNIQIWDLSSSTQTALTTYLEARQPFNGGHVQFHTAISNDGKTVLLKDLQTLWIVDGTTGDVIHNTDEHKPHRTKTNDGGDNANDALSEWSALFSDQNRCAFAFGCAWNLDSGDSLPSTDKQEYGRLAQNRASLIAKLDGIAMSANRNRLSHLVHIDPSDRFAFYTNKSDPWSKSELPRLIWYGPITIWDTKFDTAVCTLVMTDEGKWCAVAPDGRYDSSDNGELRWAYWTGFENGSKVAIGETKSKYYTPGLLPKILSGADQSPGTHLTYGELLELIGSMAIYEKASDN